MAPQIKKRSLCCVNQLFGKGVWSVERATCKVPLWIPSNLSRNCPQETASRKSLTSRAPAGSYTGNCTHTHTHTQLRALCVRLQINLTFPGNPHSLEVKIPSVSGPVMSNSLWLPGLQPIRLLCPWDSPGKNTRVGCHSLLQGIFLTQGLNPDQTLSDQTLSIIPVTIEALCLT